MCKVNLFLVSAPRSGSTQMAAWLRQSHEIGAGYIKEPNYFSNHDFSEEYVKKNHLNDVDPEQYVSMAMNSPHQFAIFRDLSHYDYLYSKVTEKWKLDASTTYLQSKEASKSLFSYNPRARIIILLRDPVERAISHYRLEIRIGRKVGSLSQEIEKESSNKILNERRFLLQESKYTDAVNRWICAFPSDQIKFIFFENMVESPEKVVNGIYEWLGLDFENIKLAATERNASAAPRLPGLNRWIQRAGIKTWARSVLPRGFKRKLRNIYFKSCDYRAISSDERARLGELLIEDAISFRELFRSDPKLYALISEWSVFDTSHYEASEPYSQGI